MTRNLLLTVSLSFLVLAMPANAEILSAMLRVNGLTCPFCAFGIEKKLLDVEGVESVEVFLDEGRLSLTFEAKNEATVSGLEQAVAKAGFELAALELTARGRLGIDAGGRARLVASPRMSFLLAERRDETTQPLGADALERLRDSAQQDASVIVTGAVGDWSKPEPTLAIDGAGVRTR